MLFLSPALSAWQTAQLSFGTPLRGFALIDNLLEGYPTTFLAFLRHLLLCRLSPPRLTSSHDPCLHASTIGPPHRSGTLSTYLPLRRSCTSEVPQSEHTPSLQTAHGLPSRKHILVLRKCHLRKVFSDHLQSWHIQQPCFPYLPAFLIIFFLQAFSTIWHMTCSFICSSTLNQDITSMRYEDWTLSQKYSLLCIRCSINIEWLSVIFLSQSNWETLQCRVMSALMFIPALTAEVQWAAKPMNDCWWMANICTVLSYVPRYSFRSFILV